MSNSIQITPENADAVLKAAADAQARHDGTAAAPEAKGEAAPTEKVVEGSTEEKPQGLEIEKKAEETKAENSETTASIDMEDVFAEYSEKGALSEETNTKLAKALETAGIKNAQGVIDQYIAGYNASVQNVRQTAFAAIGGEDNFKAMSAWAKDNLPADELASYNDAVKDPKLAKLAVSGLFAQFRAAGGAQSSPQSNRVQAGPNTGSGFEPIHNIQQVSVLTADPRYDRDPAFRESVRRRIKASKDAGIFK